MEYVEEVGGEFLCVLLFVCGELGVVFGQTVVVVIG